MDINYFKYIFVLNNYIYVKNIIMEVLNYSEFLNENENKMETLKLQPKHEDTVIGRILDIKKQIEYANQNIVPHFDEMKKWEVKEYQSVLDNYIKEFNELMEALNKDKSLFDMILKEYNLDVDKFVDKYLK